MAEQENIVIEDFDHRCQEIFPDSGERCWNLATKVIRFKGQQKAICVAHYENWLMDLASLRLKKGGE